MGGRIEGYLMGAVYMGGGIEGGILEDYEYWTARPRTALVPVGEVVPEPEDAALAGLGRQVLAHGHKALKSHQM